MNHADDEARFSIDSIPGLAWSASPDGSALSVNRRWLDYTGLAAEAAMGWGRQVAIHPDDLPKMLEVFRDALDVYKRQAYTTHVKAGYLRRNGVPSSDETTVTLHIVRHADILTIFAIIEDPIYLTEPYFISRNWQLDPKTQIPPTPAPCMPEAEVARLNGQGAVPHILPGRNPFVDEVTKMYHIPVEAVMGGAETMYPEYRRKLRDEYVAPEKCVRYCCCLLYTSRCV